MSRIGSTDYGDLSSEDFREVDSRTLGHLVCLPELIAAFIIVNDAQERTPIVFGSLRDRLASAESDGLPSPEFRKGVDDILNLLEYHVRRFYQKS